MDWDDDEWVKQWREHNAERLERQKAQYERAKGLAERYRDVPLDRALVVHDDVEPARVEDVRIAEALWRVADNQRDMLEAKIQTAPRIGKPRRIVVFLPEGNQEYVVYDAPPAGPPLPQNRNNLS